MDSNSYVVRINEQEFNLRMCMEPTSIVATQPTTNRIQRTTQEKSIIDQSGRVAIEKCRRKHVLILNSHSLSDYQRCPKRYEYNNLIQIEPSATRTVFAIGTYWGKMLEIYYRNCHKSDTVRDKLVKRMSKCAANNEQFDDKDGNMLSTRILEYWKRYRNEQVKVLGVEIGFSIILYEDNSHLFIYEGRPDRILSIPDPFNPSRSVICISDDKTRARNVDLLDYNNQINGYLVAAKTNYFMYNYMGKQMDLTKAFARQIVHRSDTELNKWKQNTIAWYHRILADRISGKFLESLQCEGQYSTCEFISLCNSKDRIEYNAAMNNNFKKRNEERRSW